MPEFLFPEDMLPGAGEEQISLREGLRTTGHAPSSSWRSSSRWTTSRPPGSPSFAPTSSRPSTSRTGAITFVAGISGGFLVLGILPMGWLADRYRRPPIIGWATLVFGLMVAATGFAINIFVFFLARFGAGISQSSTQSVHGSLLADTYPINVRGRLYAAMGMGRAWPSPPARCWWASSRPRWEAPTAGAGPSTSWPSPSCWSPSSPSAFRSRPADSSRRRTCSATCSGTRLRPRRRSRPPSSGSCASAPSRPCSSPSRPSGSGSSPAPCWATSISSSGSGSTPSSAASSAPSAAWACWSRCPSSAGTTTASTGRIRHGPCRSSARSSCPSPSSSPFSTSCPMPCSGPSSACRAASSS